MILLADSSPSPPSFRYELARRASVPEIGLFVVIPAVLVLVHFLAEPTRETLVFRAAKPTVVTAFTAHYLHQSTAHLLGNLLIYVGAVGTGYPLALLAGVRRSYRLLVVGILLGFPFVLSTTHLVLFGTGTLVGFSGLTLALVGLLPLVLFAYLRARIDGSITVNDAPALFFLGTALIAWRTSAPGSIVLPLVLASLGVSALYLVSFGRRLAREGRSPGPQRLPRGYVELPAAVVLVFFLSLAVGFPRNPIGVDGPTMHLVIHLVAFSLGFIGGFLVDRFVRPLALPAPPPPPPPD